MSEHARPPQFHIEPYRNPSETPELSVNPRRQVRIYYGHGEAEQVEVRRIPAVTDSDFRLPPEAEAASLNLLGSKPEAFDESELDTANKTTP